MKNNLEKYLWLGSCCVSGVSGTDRERKLRFIRSINLLLTL